MTLFVVGEGTNDSNDNITLFVVGVCAMIVAGRLADVK